MNFYLPMKLYEEEYAFAKHQDLVKELGKCALIVTGKNSAKKCGALDDVIQVLEHLEISHYLFDKVEENPSTDTILEAASFAQGKSIDFVIGIGGGSPMDASKAIALLLNHEGAGIEYLYDTTASSDALPVICIPTTCGTGSEVTGVSVLTRHDKNSKGSIPHRIYPTLSFVDYRYLRKLPHSILKSSSVDALCHAVESFINVKSNSYSELFSFEAIRILGQTLPELQDALDCSKAFSNSGNIGLDFVGDAKLDALFSSLIHASSLAGMAIAHTGTSIPHALSYRLTYNDQIAHGTACGYFLMDFVEKAPEIYQEELLALMGMNNIEEFSRLITSLLDFSQIKDETVALSVKEVSSNPAKMETAPFKYTI